MKKILLIGGDPNSINSELIYKSLKKVKKNVRKKIYLISNYKLLSAQFKKLKYNIKISEVVRGGDVSKEAFTDNQNGVMINSSNEDDLNLNGLIVPEAIQSTIKWLEVRKKGNSKSRHHAFRCLYRKET